jgi:hypothetical protein
MNPRFFFGMNPRFFFGMNPLWGIWLPATRRRNAHSGCGQIGHAYLEAAQRLVQHSKLTTDAAPEIS